MDEELREQELPESDQEVSAESDIQALEYENASLRGRVEHLEAELSRYRNVDELVRDFSNDMRFLVETSVGFTELSEDDDIYEFIIERLEKLAPGSIVAVSSYEKSENHFLVRKVRGFGKLVSKAAQLLGQNPEGMTAPMTEEAFERLSAGKINVAENGLRDLLGDQVPRAVCFTIEKTFGLRTIYGMGFSWKDELYGSALILTRRGTVMRRMELLEAFISQASVAIQRRRAEDEKKALESKIAQANKLEALGRLAGGVAHDFNNMLMCIQGSVTEAQKDATEETLMNLRDIESLVEGGARLCNGLLGLAREGSFEIKAQNIVYIAKRTSTLFARTHKGLDVRMKGPKEPIIVAVDERQIEQVLLNLFINANDTMSGTGTLGVEVSTISLDTTAAREKGLKEGQWAKIAVSDTGKGIPQEILPHIFDPFFTTKELGQGTGLGLPSCYGVIESHDGTIEVSTEVEKGSVFSVFLPIAADQTLAESVYPEVFSHKGSETILVIDDEVMILRSVTRFLEPLGYTVITTTNGEHAFHILKSYRSGIGLVILDMIMPGMSGHEVFEKIREKWPNMKVLVASGYSRDVQDGRDVIRRANGFIQKPFTVEQLSTKIREILDHQG